MTSAKTDLTIPPPPPTKQHLQIAFLEKVNPLTLNC